MYFNIISHFQFLWKGHDYEKDCSIKITIFLRRKNLICCNFYQVAELQDKLTAAETEIAELKNKMEDLEYYHGSANEKVDKLDRHLNDALQKLKSFEDTTVVHDGSGKGVTGVAKSKVMNYSFILDVHKYNFSLNA